MSVKQLFMATLTAVALATTSTLAQASILAGAVTSGFNSINDTNGDTYVPQSGAPQATFQINDLFKTVLLFNNITNSAGTNTPLTTAVGTSPYQLAAVATFKVIDVQPSVFGAGRVDLQFSGTIDVFESTNPLQFVNFTTDTFAGATAKVVAGSPLLSLSTDFFHQNNAPSGIGTFLPGEILIADGGLSVTANPGGIPILPGATPVSYTDYNPPPFPLVTTFHDMTARVQLFINVGANAGEFPLRTDTDISFTASTVVPEAASFLIWGGLALVGGLVTKARRS